MTMAPIWSSQPFKAMFIVMFACKKALQFTFYSIKYLFVSGRPIPEWSFKTSIGVEVVRALFELWTATRFQHPPQLSAGKSGERFVIMEPPDSEFFSGILNSEKVQPTPTGAVWYPAPIRKEDSDVKTRKVAIHIPGGAFVLGWDPEETVRTASTVLSKHYGSTNVIYVQYRLAGPEAQFPAAIQDALTAYKYILDLGVPAENITLVGDSAGGNIALALLRYLETAQTALPSPGNVMCFSPWVDASLESGTNYTQNEGSRIDLLDGQLLTWGARAYIPEGELSEEATSYITPLYRPFATKTPLFIAAGGVEGFCNGVCEYANQMSRTEGSRVKLHVSKFMPHDFFLAYPFLGSEAEAGAALEEALEFFKQCQ
ncbi:Alpha/Beta hydrolase protein [Astrocystis sublimbata]|nr:Alpha/Beta hydrolase protein [Astrocystis sublimbata]